MIKKIINYLLPTTDHRLLITDSGFSFIELLVVVSLFGIVGYLTTSIFIIGFRAQAKSEIMKEVKQNGDYAMQVIESAIKNSIDIITPAPPLDSASGIVVTNPDGNTTTFLCKNDIITAENSYPVPTPVIVNDLTSNKVIVKLCKFKIVAPPTFKSSKYAVINFTVSQTGGEGIPEENKASLPYQSTISLRIYK
jgi:prepilin-type N-terminal cleavage/methylation domain-containing protein